jgi:hypothetical protein
MIPLAPRLDLRLLYHPPGVHAGVPHLASAPRVAGDAGAVLGDDLGADKVDGVEVLGEHDHMVAAVEQVIQPGGELAELAVLVDLAQFGDVVLQVQPLLLQLLAALRVGAQPQEPVALAVEGSSGIDLIVVILALAHRLLELCGLVHDGQVSLDCADQFAAAFQALAEPGERTGQPLAEHGHQETDAAALIGLDLGQPVELAAQLVDAAVQGFLGLGLEGDRHVLGLPVGQPGLEQATVTIGPQRLPGVAEHVDGQRRLPTRYGVIPSACRGSSPCRLSARPAPLERMRCTRLRHCSSVQWVGTSVGDRSGAPISTARRVIATTSARSFFTVAKESSRSKDRSNSRSLAHGPQR